MGISLRFSRVLNPIVQGGLFNYRKVPDKVLYGLDGPEAPDGRPAMQELEARSHLMGTVNALGESVFTEPSLEQPKLLGVTTGYLEYQQGMLDTSEKINRPGNWVLLDLGLQAVVDHFPVLQQLVPLSVRSVKLEVLQKMFDHLQLMRQMRKVVAPFLFRIDNTIAFLENSMVDMLRPIHDTAASSLQSNHTLATAMDPLMKLFNENALKAAESRKDNAVLTTDAREAGRAEGRAEAAAEFERQRGAAAGPTVTVATAPTTASTTAPTTSVAAGRPAVTVTPAANPGRGGTRQK